jgi:hypothetical protein
LPQSIKTKRVTIESRTKRATTAPVVVTRAIFRRRFTSLPSARSRPTGGVIPISLIEVILQLGACLLEKRDSPHWCAIVFRDYEQGVENIADLARSIDGAVTHPIPSRPFRLAGMLSQPHGARKGPPKGKVRRAQTPPGAVSPRRRPIASEAQPPAAGDTCQEAEAVASHKRTRRLTLTGFFNPSPQTS